MPVIIEPGLDRWFRGLPHDGPVPAVILSGSVNALSHARSLGRRGVPVLVIDDKRRSATRSRYARALIMPEGVTDPEAWLDALDSIGRRLPVPGLLIPTGDRDVDLVARNAQALARRFRFLVPEPEDAAAILDKTAQYRRAALAGIRVPRSCGAITLDELRAAAREVGFPCLLKPSSPAGRKLMAAKAIVAENLGELEAAYRAQVADPGGFVVQEIIPGDDSELYGYLAFWDAHGREHSCLTKHKVRQFPTGFGTGSTQETVVAPEVADLSRQLLSAFSYRGIVGVEWKRDARDGSWCLIEINARSGTCNQLAISAGVDLPWIAYQEILGQPISRTVSTSSGLTWVNEELEVLALAELRRDGAVTMAEWLRSVMGARSWAMWSWRDPLPFLMRSPALARGLYRAFRATPARSERTVQPRRGSGSEPKGSQSGGGGGRSTGRASAM